MDADFKNFEDAEIKKTSSRGIFPEIPDRFEVLVTLNINIPEAISKAIKKIFFIKN